MLDRCLGFWESFRASEAREEKYMGRQREKPDQRDVVFRDRKQSAPVRGDVWTGGSFAGATTLDL